MRRIAGIAVVLVALVVCVASQAEAAPGPFHMHDLHGSVVRESSGLYLRLGATACFRSLAEARDSIEIETRITMFSITRSPTRWRPFRTVIDRIPSLDTYGWSPSWHGPCGKVGGEELIPGTALGAETIGSQSTCFGAELTITELTFKTKERRTATQRTIVKCGAVHY
jgi:hypothetical protein